MNIGVRLSVKYFNNELKKIKNDAFAGLQNYRMHSREMLKYWANVNWEIVS